MGGKIKIAIDSGGTFTDCIGNKGTGEPEDDVVIKLLSVDPKNYPDAPLEGIRRLLEVIEGKSIPRGSPLDLTNVSSIRMGTTLATNCALERNGERCALVVTKGFRDIIEIGDQTRPDIFNLKIEKPAPLYDMVVEVDERVTLEDYAEDPLKRKTKYNGDDIVQGRSGESVRILSRPQKDQIASVLRTIYEAGIRSIAVALLQSYTFPEHELVIHEIAKSIGFQHISLSSEVSPMIKYLPRTHSAIADAYLTPVIKGYLDRINSGLHNRTDTSLQFMQSDGGLVDGSRFSGLKSILSGPAGGVIGYSRTCYDSETNTPLIGFDMGGTSTDVSRFSDGKLEHIFETKTAGIVIQSPQLDIHTVAAGGSSILKWENGLFKVGPESATADPGPACYRKGGPLAITDANLLLGRLVPRYFPTIFGPNEDEGLDIEMTRRKFTEITEVINREQEKTLTVEEVALGFLKVANEAMVRPIRAITEAKGYMVSEHQLVTFGGAGGQHAVAVAAALGISTVLIHRYSSILSAYGIFLADVVEDSQKPCSYTWTKELEHEITTELEHLRQQNEVQLNKEGFSTNKIDHDYYLNMRYEGTETSIMIRQIDETREFHKWFTEIHQRQFGFHFDSKAILIDDIRVRSIGRTERYTEESVARQLDFLKTNNQIRADVNPQFHQRVYFDGGWVETPVFSLKDLDVGNVIRGPAILADGTQTNILPKDTSATILKTLIVVNIDPPKKEVVKVKSNVDPVLLSIFSHRFMDIAEQMGNQLRLTSVSTNVKERLDFSCALFDAYGNLVANAPHVPVHLGSMSSSISAQAKIWKGKLTPGDVIITNHPDNGGTHLPDITVITPSFSSDREIIFFVASRAHHSDIGGTLPGSIPPNSKFLYEEGAIIFSELVVRNNKFLEDEMYNKFVIEPAQYEGCSGARRFSDNISDIKAQIAANSKGISLINNLVTEFGLNIIMKYMHAIQKNARDTIKRMLADLVKHFSTNTFEGYDQMDDGSTIKLKVTLDPIKEDYIFDFTGTSPQMYGNLNAPHAIANSAIIYCLRCLVGEEIPLNQGCIDPLTIILPEGSLLNPKAGVAVVGGNVLTSQRICDVILKTFGIMADSQGDCNNFTFGARNTMDDQGNSIPGFGYYETICGGSGAGAPSILGKGWDGANAVHTNMTNTRMTDSEIFERRYPVLLRKFRIRKDSGGKGKYKGGNGVVRDIQFREKVIASILSERRVLRPNGLYGGESGSLGENLWVKQSDNTIVNIGGKNTVEVDVGDRFIIKTPGGGGVGKPNNEKNR
ncbi:5-oxoprolinase RNJ42_00351 [Nakaseomyces bracarensis]|uniref:5-oxoprolinase n=1 Tax=Nakaseomyces bracarensis TaxID=273131 RepID=UPI003871A319